MKKILALVGVIVLLCGCYKQSSPNLGYDEVLGYNIYEMIGYPQEDVLKQLIKQDLDPELVSEDNHAYLFSANVFSDGEEGAYLVFTKDDENDSLVLYQYGVQVAEEGQWPEKESVLSEEISKLYQSLVNTYGEPSDAEPVALEAAAIMNTPANRHMEWDDEEKNLHISFFLAVGEGDVPFRAGFDYCDLKEYQARMAALIG